MRIDVSVGWFACDSEWVASQNFRFNAFPYKIPVCGHLKYNHLSSCPKKSGSQPKKNVYAWGCNWMQAVSDQTPHAIGYTV